MFACLGLKNWIFLLEHGSLHGEDSWSSEGMLKVEGMFGEVENGFEFSYIVVKTIL